MDLPKKIYEKKGINEFCHMQGERNGENIWKQMSTILVCCIDNIEICVAREKKMFTIIISINLSLSLSLSMKFCKNNIDNDNVKKKFWNYHIPLIALDCHLDFRQQQQENKTNLLKEWWINLKFMFHEEHLFIFKQIFFQFVFDLFNCCLLLMNGYPKFL